MEHGLHFIGNVKRNNCGGFPMNDLEESIEDEDAGSVECRTVEYDGCTYNALVYKQTGDLLRHMIFTASVSRMMSDEKWKQRLPWVNLEYVLGAPAVDVHNHFRQGILALERAIRTHKWPLRIFLTLFGMSVTNAYCCYKKWSPLYDEESTFDEYVYDLALEMVKLTAPADQLVPAATPSPTRGSSSRSPASQAPATPAADFSIANQHLLLAKLKDAPESTKRKSTPGCVVAKMCTVCGKGSCCTQYCLICGIDCTICSTQCTAEHAKLVSEGNWDNSVKRGKNRKRAAELKSKRKPPQHSGRRVSGKGQGQGNGRVSGKGKGNGNGRGTGGGGGGDSSVRLIGQVRVRGGLGGRGRSRGRGRGLGRGFGDGAGNVNNAGGNGSGRSRGRGGTSNRARGGSSSRDSILPLNLNDSNEDDEDSDDDIQLDNNNRKAVEDSDSSSSD